MINEARIRSFLALAEQLNFSRAAESLHISQQALSAQVTALEADIGVTLFWRTTKSVRITPVGRALYELFSDTARKYEGILARHARDEHPSLRLGCFEGLDVGAQISGACGHVERVKGKFSFKIILKDTFMNVLKGLINDEYDLAILPLTKGYAQEKIRIKPLFNDPLYVFISPKHPAAKENLRLTDLRDAVFFAGQEQTLAKEHLNNLCASLGFTPIYREDESDPAVERMLVENGQGVSFGGKYSMYYRNKDLIRLDLGVTLALVAAWKNNYQNNVLDLFLNALSDIFDKL